MSDSPTLSPTVYRLAQRRFDTIPGAPWVYWVGDSVRALFETLPRLGDVAQPRQGLATADNLRFLRFWWEVGTARIGFGCRDRDEAQASGRRWFPYAKGGANISWYGNLEHVVNWNEDGSEIRSLADAVIRNPEFYFQEGLTFNRFGTDYFAMRWLRPGFVFDCNGPSVFGHLSLELLTIANTKLFSRLCTLINPGANFQVGDVQRVPIVRQINGSLVAKSTASISLVHRNSSLDETTFDFIAPPRWETGLADLAAAQARLAALERAIDDEVYRLYGLSEADRAAIEAEMGGTDQGPTTEDQDDVAEDEPLVRGPSSSVTDEAGEAQPDEGLAVMTREELAVRWVSYAVGVVLGRFAPGEAGALGRAVYRRADFAVGSLPAPDAAEFDALVGATDRFAWVDDEGARLSPPPVGGQAGEGRHVFPAAVEVSLRDLVVPDGITVLDEGHPRDLATRVEAALDLMLGEARARAVVQAAAGDGEGESATANLRAFLARDFFTRWHLRWYRKRPVYWPLQSARRGYGFVVFHEGVRHDLLYVLLRTYLDQRLNGLRLQVADLTVERDGKAGRERRAVERRLEAAQTLLNEVDTFAGVIDRLAHAGYEPAADWIDDGVLLRLAPLWELLPLWKAEPKKAWERLSQGDFDWSHIALRYWPDRVRAKCATNKSFAIAHGL